MTTEERFESIETTLQRVADLQDRQAVALIELTGAVSRFIDETNAASARANARMEQIEANLDGLIRAITAEHTNGKKGQ
jgi:hypothetical protein